MVRVDPGSDELLLGKAYFATGPARIPVGFFLLEQRRPFERGNRARSAPARLEPHVQVVVVVRERLDAPGRPAEAGVRADEDHLRARREEAVHELLRQAPVDLGGVAGASSRPSARG